MQRQIGAKRAQRAAVNKRQKSRKELLRRLDMEGAWGVAEYTQATKRYEVRRLYDTDEEAKAAAREMNKHAANNMALGAGYSGAVALPVCVQKDTKRNQMYYVTMQGAGEARELHLWRDKAVAEKSGGFVGGPVVLPMLEA